MKGELFLFYIEVETLVGNLVLNFLMLAMKGKPIMNSYLKNSLDTFEKIIMAINISKRIKIVLKITMYGKCYLKCLVNISRVDDYSS